MITILTDHNMEGQAIRLWDTLAKTDLIKIVPMRFAMFADVGLPRDSSDREVWRFVQANRMLLLTDNRSDNEKDSLEQTIREENTLNSLPVLTVGRLSRMKERYYRERCAEKIAEIVSDIKNYQGTGRIFIP
ncbi:hypothetical protein QUF90_05815 [Desulfococcaceae bacterium HSG9]|nr:hypothetical protein [Desulfococcaceae bacterium HSG9]